MSTQYRQADGTFTSNGAMLAGGAAAGDTASAAMAVARAWYAVERDIPVAAAIAFAGHESGFVTNIYTVESNGHTTGGVFEIDLPSLYPYFNKGDAVVVGMPDKANSWYDLDDCCLIFAARLRGYKVRIIAAANSYNAANGLAPVDETQLGVDFYAYLGIAHNLGIGTAISSIRTYGMNWAAFKARPENASLNIVQDRANGNYGDDISTGGKWFTEDMAAPFDAAGAVIPAPVIDAFWQSNIRLGVVLVLLALVAYFFAINKTPLKGTL